MIRVNAIWVMAARRCGFFRAMLSSPCHGRSHLDEVEAVNERAIQLGFQREHTTRPAAAMQSACERSIQDQHARSRPDSVNAIRRVDDTPKLCLS
jgi:hypothetical protein